MTSTTRPQQPVTDELRRWIQSQLATGCSPGDVLAAMRASGWSEAVAELALSQVAPTVEAPR